MSSQQTDSVYEWTKTEPRKSLHNLIKYLEGSKYIESGAASYSESVADYLPIAHFAICGFFDEEEVIKELAKELNLPQGTVAPESIPSLLQLLDIEPCSIINPIKWRKLRMIPLSVSDTEVEVAVANPYDYEAIHEIEFALNLKVKPVIAREQEIVTALDQKLSLTDQDAIDFIVKDVKKPLELKNVSGRTALYESSSMHDDSSAAPVVRLVNKIFSQTILCGASDLHITPQKSCLMVKVRIDGIMRPLFKIPNELRDAVISRIKLLCGMDLSEKRLPQDGRLRIKTAQGVKDTRISTVPATYGENIVARVLSTTLAGKSFESLGMEERTRNAFERALRQSSRVHLVTGPTGSGKTSTLYTSLLKLIDGQTNIITLEDPIEYRIEGITQIQINPKLQLNFSQGLRSILRQDPDVVLVGEIRDEETASISMKVAQTGHIVLSTLHTNTAAAAITRLRDLGVPSYLIASSLGSVMAQRLVRRLCPDCCVPCEESGSTSKPSALDNTSLMKAVGCKKCGETGYVGRVGIFSFFEVTEAVREAIRDECGENEIARRARMNGFRTLEEAAIDLLNQGLTTVEEVERVLGSIMFDTEIDAAVLVPGGATHALDSAPEGKPRVLLVEDDDDSRSVISCVLEQELFSVDVASGGHEALEMLYESTPDLIISDVMMPKMGGIELLQRLRSDRRLRDIPVLMLTANGSQEAELKLMNCGADDFVCKTTQMEIILARARRLVRRI